jgi:hypothetical protein
LTTQVTNIDNKCTKIMELTAEVDNLKKVIEKLKASDK